ncbi:LacI family DNA-binding transcriptional regulator [Catellatospora sp. KI3]|uniref:LacI family DNA-binding transcriptional regulator n=1 Tax=Catellatospora sp. KI3 TaxID=3041620 RepID=UPI0024822125|nr:LacI family DNA-binding transcriptional regulator [Catellatospora sp. KI3]MDI1466422.1 LacI family DNA-binding transcriptional regulator [Catellatospora sp. KI3]
MLDSPGPARRRRVGDLPVAAIAELAGVSPPTVSKVLNGRAGVGEQTRRRVEALLRDHGYRRSAPAQPSQHLEVVFHNMLSSIAMEIMRGVAEVAAAQDLTFGYLDVSRRGRTGPPWVDTLLRRRPAAVIAVTSAVTAEHREALEANGVPLVALDPTSDLHSTPSIGATNWSGALDATRHLLDLGHRRIGVLSGPVKDLSSRARLDGLRAAMDAAGAPFDKRLLRNGLYTFEQGRELALELLRLPDPPTAVVCGDDLQALGVYEAARIEGLRIPYDLSVVGFDDVEHAAWCAPPLTTVRQPFAEMGATAARFAVELAAGETPRRTRIELATTLIVRGSTAPPRT